jgi:DNA-binding NarL/FixJ family response regulator
MTAIERRILIVEDDDFIGSLMAGALSNEGFDALHTPNALSAKALLKTFDPDIVVVDIDLGDGPSGIEFVQMIRRTRPEIAAILLSKHADSQGAGYPADQIPPGVSYLRKSLVRNTAALVASIEATIRGNTENLRQDKQSKGPLDLLTKAQREILHMMALGLSNQEIAKRRAVSVSNVEQRVSEIFKAFGLDQEGLIPRVEAVRLYIAVSGIPER